MATITVNSDGGADHTTIQDAVSAASANDEIQILNSATYQPVRVFINKNLNFTVASGQTPIIDGTAADAGNRPTFDDQAAACVLTFTGFTFQNFGASNSTNKIADLGGVITLQYNQCTFKDIDISIFHAPPVASSGVPHKLDRCEILQTSTKKLFESAPGGDWHFLIQNSVFHYTGTHSGEVYIDAGNNNHVNGIVRNCSLLVEVNSSTDASNGVVRCGTIENTIIKNAATSGGNAALALKAKSGYSNNCIFGNFDTGEASTGASTTGLVTSDPLFVNHGAAPPNLRLEPNSPCVDTGKTIAAVTVDFDGVARPQGANYDIGAFELAIWSDEPGNDPFERKFGSNGFEIRSIKNKLRTRKFRVALNNRQAPFSLTLPGPPSIRGATTSYKTEE